MLNWNKVKGYVHLNWDVIANYIFELGILVEGVKKFFNNWIFTTNHKKIGFMYIIFGIYASILGIFLSLIIRLQLMAPGQELIWISSV